jgi:glycerate kinase
LRMVIAPDSFKGSLSAYQVADTIRRAVKEVFPESVLDVVPMADGGEGTLDALIQATQGEYHTVPAHGPLMEPISARYGVLGDGETVVLEVASVAGLPMVPEDRRNPEETTSYGLGELICDALDKGYRRFIIGLGGSATNDGGLGMLQALGARFFDDKGEQVRPVGGALAEIVSVDLTTLDPRLSTVELRIASDVNNPLCGPQGASEVFGPQKGATEDQVRRLDDALARYAELIEQHVHLQLQTLPGAGAAGGVGYALLLLGGHMASGAQVVAEAVGLEERLAGADWVITGEGRSDGQTRRGKVPYYVAQLTKRHGVKALLLSGSLADGWESLAEYFVSMHAIVHAPMSLTAAMADAETLLYKSAWNLARLIRACTVS